VGRGFGEGRGACGSFGQGASRIRSRGGAGFSAAEPTEVRTSDGPRRVGLRRSEPRAPRLLGFGSSLPAQAVIVRSSRGSSVRSLSFRALPRSGVGQARPYPRPSRRRPGRALFRGAIGSSEASPALRGFLALDLPFWLKRSSWGLRGDRRSSVFRSPKVWMTATTPGLSVIPVAA